MIACTDARGFGARISQYAHVRDRQGERNSWKSFGVQGQGRHTLGMSVIFRFGSPRGKDKRLGQKRIYKHAGVRLRARGDEVREAGPANMP